MKSMVDINNEQYTDRMTKELNEFKENNKYSYSVLEGGHYIYYTKSKEIGKETREFLGK